MAASLDVLTGAAIEAMLPDIARLRIKVFREFPYLYDGSLDYERRYLSAFAAAPGAVMVTVQDAGRIVGASTGLPLSAEHAAFRAPVEHAGIDVGSVFYCAESVLEPDYRGRGFGHGFFDAREAHARRLGFRCSAFCAVLRPADHPARPPDYRPLDSFWRKRGYSPMPGIVASYSWPDLGAAEETTKELQFWMKGAGNRQ
jgi:GNAT superfamily N-acetyltransferase